MRWRRPNSGYWEEFRTVVEVQIDRRQNKSASTLIPGLPDMWKDSTLEDAVEAVHHPVLGNYHRELLVIFNAQGLKLDGTIFTPRGNRDYIGREVRLNELLTWAIGVGTVAPLDFMIKWTVVMPRPEEIAWKITTKELTAEGWRSRRYCERRHVHEIARCRQLLPPFPKDVLLILPGRPCMPPVRASPCGCPS
jgi:hypothetical protein